MNRSLCSIAAAAVLAAAPTAGALAQQTTGERTATPGPKHELPLLFVRAPSELSGTIRAIDGSVLTLRTRTGQNVRVDAAQALRRQQSTVLLVGRSVDVRGAYDDKRVLHAQTIVRAKPSAAVWRPDL
jgi:hypothetical protein